jgi:hypothetical protein
MSFVLNPSEGNSLAAPDYVTNSNHLLTIAKVLNDIYKVIQGNPYYSILIELGENELEDENLFKFWLTSMIRQYENLDLYELGGLTLFAIHKDDKDERSLRLFIIKKREIK